MSTYPRAPMAHSRVPLINMRSQALVGRGFTLCKTAPLIKVVTG